MSLDELDEYMLIRRSKFDSTPAGTVTVPESKIYTTSECTALFLDKQMRVRRPKGQICGSLLSNPDLYEVFEMLSMGSSMGQDGRDHDDAQLPCLQFENSQ